MLQLQYQGKKKPSLPQHAEQRVGLVKKTYEKCSLYCLIIFTLQAGLPSWKLVFVSVVLSP
jgi:hypothetical protein